MKKLSALTVAIIMSVMMAVPAMATDGNIPDQQQSNDKRQESRTSIGKLPPAQKNYQQKRSAAKKRRDAMLKKRQQTIKDTEQAGDNAQ